MLVLKAYDGTHDVVVKNGTGNIKLAGSEPSPVIGAVVIFVRGRDGEGPLRD